VRYGLKIAKDVLFLNLQAESDSLNVYPFYEEGQ
jgi:hypothetical protein